MTMLRPLLWLIAAVSLACHAEPSVDVTVRSVGDAFIIDAVIEAPVTREIAWDVLTDFDHMADIVTNLKSSRVLRRDGNDLLVAQEGTARYGPLSYSFQSEREIRLEPMTRILAHGTAGTAKRMETESRLVAMPEAGAIRVEYHAEIVPDSFLARTFGAPAVRHEVQEQFLQMLEEMKRRAARSRPGER